MRNAEKEKGPILQKSRGQAQGKKLSLLRGSCRNYPDRLATAPTVLGVHNLFSVEEQCHMGGLPGLGHPRSLSEQKR